MNRDQMMKILKDTDHVRRSGTEAESRAAEYLRDRCLEMGVNAVIEPFRVGMADILEAHVWADGVEIPAKGVFLCGSGEVEGELYYMPATDPVSIAGAKGKIVLLDTLGIGYYAYQDLVEAGALGILFRCGNMYYPFDDIDERDLREHVVGGSKKLLSAMLNAKTAVGLVKNGVKRIRISVRQNEYDGESHNVIAEIPGRNGKFVVLTAHYDSVALSHGAYDNMTGCIGLLGVLDALRKKEHNYGIRVIFCGSEERGLLGSKAYVRGHEPKLGDIALDVNLDMIGTYMGMFKAIVSAEERLAGYISYLGAELGFPVSTRVGVHPSDSSPFADKGVPAVSFERDAGGNVAPIHCRFDTMDVVSPAQLESDISFITEFTRRMADSAVCPVSRDMPEKVKKDLDEYMFRKRKSL